jgi:hypothetical protein
MKPPTIKIRVIEGSKLVRLARLIPLIAAIMAPYSTIPAYIILVAPCPILGESPPIYL